MNIKFGGADNRSIKLLEDFTKGFFISEFVDNHNKKILDFLIENYFKNGAALFGRESPYEIQEFRKVTKGGLDKLSDKDIVGIIQFFVQRLRNYAHVESLWQARIKEARIVPTEIPRTRICEFYEGKLISVETAYNQIKYIQTLTPDQYFQEILNKEFEIPPLYRFCRCRLIAIIPSVDNSYERQKPKTKEKTVWDYHNEFQNRAANIQTENFSEVYELGLKVSEMLKNYVYQRARLERQIGEIVLAKGDKSKALFHFKKAFQIDKKVGVKKLIEKLSKDKN